jgi:RNA polymerase sigma-70 factor, ECF subfamily
MQDPDPATVRLAATGDLVAFTALVREMQPHVWRFIRHLVSDDDLAADLTQETFVRLHRSIGSFRHEAGFRTWLLRIARNLVIDEQRRASRRPQTSSADAALMLADVAPGPSWQAELNAALLALPTAQREAIILVEVFGLRYREAAEVLGTAEGTVKSRVFNARTALVRWIESDDHTEQRHG